MSSTYKEPVKSKVVEPVVEEFVPFDPWRPVLKVGTPSLQTTAEQESYIREILDICCSDSAFAKKAYTAIQYILTTEAPAPPVLTSISPNTAVVSTPVTIVATGTGFTATSVIAVSGVPAVTVFVSETELSADVTAGAVEGVVPVTVDVDGVIVGPVDFTVTPVAGVLSTPSSKGQEKK